MSKPTGGAYGAASDDTSFRKKYDKEEYAAKAKDREAAEREESKARYEAKLAGKKYYKPLTGEETHTQARNTVLDLSSHVGKTQLVAAGAGVGKRGRGAGFYCEACDLTFKDNVQWVEHINSMQHLRATGQTGEVRAASAEDVRRRVDEVWERRMELEREKVTGLQERIKIHVEDEEREREERRKKRREAEERRRLEREKEKTVKVEYGEDVRVEGEHDEEDMMAAMGITGFGTSKR
ncbi:U4/U6.U5 small nuclear ribonucleoprotein component snu23 [Cytospora mali]|uniref:U4/U6.U5 small nuclear ribonucleoprotein component snu23 n=1 Tax=Cytospora mali TaxID=578113 RepID=A0A194UW30_CYTMA|nr:U4/U6.U5 small nuclear ribonucleoprotein component snu23 [Valsa mali var. pyri (nom. inval.)]